MEDSTLANPPPVPSGRASPRFVSEDRRNHAFRSLISDIAERLSESDIKNIIWQQDIPTSQQNRISALEVLEYLYKNGFYTEYEVRPLAQLLKDIHREDLTSRVDAFWKQFGRHFSNIDDSMRSHAARQFLKGRRSTLSSGNPLIVVVSPNSENPEIPTIAATTEESQESKAAGLPYDVMSSSPSSLSVLSIPSIPESQPGNDHASQPEQLGIKIPLQHHYSLIHSRSEGVLRTGSSISLHRPALKHRLSEPLSSSCSQLEFPPRRHVHPDGKYMIHPHKMHHSVSQEYHHQPQKYGYGHQPICTKSSFHSDGSPNCSPSDYFISQNGHFQADLTPPTTACNCVKNLCPHCGGISVSNHQPAMIYLPAVSYPAHQAESPVTMTSSEDTRRTKTHPTPSKGYIPRAKRKLDTDQLPSTTAVMEQPTGNQNPAESDSESDHCSSTDDQELHPNMHAKDKEVSDGSIKATESSAAVRKSKNKKDAKRRPHSAGTGQAVTTTSAKSNLHASADALAEGINSQATSGAKPTWKHVLFPAKPKIAHPEPNQVIWPVRRDRLNKYIYKYTRKLKTCKAKLELVPDQDNCGPLPKFNLQLHPYGSEDDGNKYITAKVTIELPKKFRLLSTRKIEFHLSAREDDPTSGKKIGCKKAQQEQVTKSFFYIKRFISHEELKNCHCNHVYVIAAVKLI